MSRVSDLMQRAMASLVGVGTVQQRVCGAALRFVTLPRELEVAEIDPFRVIPEDKRIDLHSRFVAWRADVDRQATFDEQRGMCLDDVGDEEARRLAVGLLAIFHDLATWYS